jgi:DNA-binding transcriptional MerR regulator
MKITGWRQAGLASEGGGMSKPNEAFPTKLFYQIREVSELTGVKPHVLRFWETEFSRLRPEKASTGQRLYREKDIKLVQRIKQLLYDEKFTIAGAKKRLQEDSRADKIQIPLNLGLRESDLLHTIHRIKNDLEKVHRLLNS